MRCQGPVTSKNSTFVGSGIGNVAHLYMYNTILAYDSTCVTPVTAGNNNLIEANSTTACGLADGVNGNIIGSHANLGARTGWSQYPQYFELDASSPAIDAGDDSICSTDPINSTSQNGVTRPQGAHCDIGSYEAPPPPVVDENQTLSNCECDVTSLNGAIAIIGKPINTHTGGYWYQADDISIPTSAGMLTFTRDYASFGTNQSTTLSPGWTHNQATRLIMPSDPGGQAGAILFKLHSANIFTFYIQPNDIYTPAPGITASLVRQSGSPIRYLLTDSLHQTYTFDEIGKLLTYADAQSHTWTYTYYGNGNLNRIAADGGSEYLNLNYDSQGRIVSVTDQTGRSVTYHYDSNGDLDSVTDVLNQTWTYEYNAVLAHYLTRVAAPGNVTVERTDYYSNGKAWKQFDGENHLIVELTYNADGTTTIKDALNHTETHAYDARGTLVSQIDPLGGETEKAYLSNFRPFEITDAQGHNTNLNWSSNGANLTKVIDAKGSQTNIAYNSLNTPTSVIDPTGYETKYFYADINFPTLPTRVEYPLSFDNGVTYIGTDYEYYPPASGAFAGKVKFVTDALGNKTYYTYTTAGQTASVTTAYGTPNAQTVSYGYDSLGRITDTTDAQGIITHNEYDAAGQLLKTTRNYVPARQQNDENNYNLITEYRYDVRGNQIAVIDTYDTITRTYYDLANRPVAVVQNLTGQTIEAVMPPARGSGSADENIRTDTEYDDTGNVVATVDAAGVTTRTYYDSANRPNLTIQNFVGSGAYDPAYPDQNIRTETTYDANGSVIASTDTLGVITRTYYDELNRPITVVQNLTGQAISVNTPPGHGSSSNIRTDTVYDANGNVIATVDPKGVITRTYYDALNRPITVVQNLAGRAISNSTPPPASTGATDSNIRSDTYYDQAGNVIATVDPRGIVSRTYYDSTNRPMARVQNWIGTNIYDNTIPTRGSGQPDENVRTDIAYDAFGRRDTTADPLGRVTKYEYDELGQLIKTTSNYVNAGLPQNDQNQRNIVTQYEYDALGRQLKNIDTLGRVNLNAYDSLSRILTTTQNYLEGQSQNYKDASGNQYNLTSSFTYDARGNQITVTDTKGIVNRTYYDALGRSVEVLRNVNANPPSATDNVQTNTVYLGNGSVDYALDELDKKTDYTYDSFGRLITITDPLLNTTNYQYDANGNRTLMTDANAVATSYEYDSLNRLKAVVENYRVGNTPNADTNVRTEYIYDAVGNRLSIKDGNNHTTVFAYSAVGQLKTETDAIGNITTSGYDAIGNRVSMLDANGKTTLFGYDEMNHLSLIDYPAPDADVNFTYDALGHRLAMTDGLGSTTWNYTNLDQPKSITDPFSASVAYDYDAAGNRTKLTYPDSRVVNYGYNALNQLTSAATNGLGNTDYQYDATGHLKTVIRPNGVNTNYQYKDNGWLDNLNHSLGSTTLASYQYQYDNVGNRTQALENVSLPTLPPTATPTATNTFTPTATATQTFTPTATNTFTPTATNTYTPTATNTFTPTATNTYTPTVTNTFTSTVTNTFTPTVTNTFTPTATKTFTPTATNTFTPTFSPTATNTPTSSSSGWINPAANATATGGDGNGFQTNPTNVYSDNATFAVDTDSGTNTNTTCSNTGKDRHVFYSYNLASVPNGSSILGIEVRLDMKVDATSGAPASCIELSWDGGTTWTAAKTSTTFTTTEASYILGGSADTWGRTWSTSELNNLRVRITNISSNNSRDFSLDWIPVRVSYVTPTATATFTPTATNTVTFTPTATVTPSRTPTATFTPTATRTSTPTNTATSTASSSGAFPTMGILDNFNRANGAIGPNWSGSTNVYSITSNQLTIQSSGNWNSDVYWNNTTFGTNQEAYVTIAHTDTNTWEQNLLLKSQNNEGEYSGVIEVLYDAANQHVVVNTYDSTNDWVQHGANIPVTFSNGDQFGARALANGIVEVYKNGTLLASRDVTAWPYYAGGGYIGLLFANATSAILDDFGGGSASSPSAFPNTGILDNFNRADGTLNSGTNWSGWTQYYSIFSNQLTVGSSDAGNIYWSNASFGADQEAYITFSQVDTQAGEQDILLKSQSASTWQSGILEVEYDAPNHRVLVGTYEWPQGWVGYGADIPATFMNGDVFGARAKANGIVEVYKNGTLLATRDVSSWSHYADGGYIGLWFINATNALLDNFGGGTIASGGSGFAPSGQSSASMATVTADPYNVQIKALHLFWQGIPLGSNQIANVTFTHVNPNVNKKPESNGISGDGTVDLLYDASNQRIQIWTYSTQTGWTQHGADIPVTFADGDVFSAQAHANGTIEIYRNGILLTTRTLTDNPPVLAKNSGVFQPVSYQLPAPAFAPFQQSSGSTTINYVYDPLYRLKDATYSTGDYYHYTYDAVGNRLTQNTLVAGLPLTTTYAYDNANRVQSVNGVTYSFDANGNLLYDGVNTYTYDSANRLKTLTGSGTTATYQYNGLGDRLRETTNGSATTFTMDLNSGLTQALSDGTNTYVYGLDRIAQTNATTTDYFLGDALGSVRQLTNQSGAVTYARAYDPYGVVTQTSGTSQSAYGYTSEYSGDSTELLYLRARHYAPDIGRFLTRDTWNGDYNRPLSLNRWMYVEGNPVNITDPTGKFPEWCKSMQARLQYEDCVRRVYHLTAPMYYQVMPESRQEGSQGCWSGAVAYRAPGYLVGHAHAFNFGISYTRGEESVFDFGTMERGKFTFETAGLALDASVSEVGYHGIIIGFNNVQPIEDKYNGPYVFGASGLSSANFLLGASLGVGVTGFVSFDRELTGISEYYSIGYGYNLLQVGSASAGVGLSTWTRQKQQYASSNNDVDFNRLNRDVYHNPDFPALNFIPSSNMNGIALVLAAHFTWIYEEIQIASRK